MKGAFLYVDAGKGHYIPAIALADSFKKAGHEVVVEDLFVAFKTPFWRWFCKNDWRFCLRHPSFERILHSITDSRINYYLVRNEVNFPGRVKSFAAWYEREKPDFIVSTNFLGGVILPKILKKAGIDIPIFQYVADVFDTPVVGVCNEIDRFYVPSDLGIEYSIKRGQLKDTVSRCPFPIRAEFKDYEFKGKKESRANLGLKDKFTILITLGGEGIGDDKILHGLARRGLDVQVVIIGGNHESTQRDFDAFKAKYPDFDLVRPGFVNNVFEYLDACDMQVGKAGANALMEAMYLQRPCLISEVLFMARKVEEFFAESKVGWCEDNLEKKLDIIESCYRDESILTDIAKRFENLPLSFSSDKFRDQILEDYDKIKSGRC